MSHHVNGVPECPSCNEKLLQANDALAKWFKTQVKVHFPDCHVSWSYRDKASQNQFHAEGKSQLPYPLSAHNKCDALGNPCSHAIDLFELCSNGMARWSWAYFKKINDTLKDANPMIVWGGLWKSIGDADHFQITV